MNAVILSIGDELVLGQTVDTNSAWISRQLAGVGCAVLWHITVGDDQRGIEDAIREAVERCDVVIITGGIGPTPDDLTRQALSAASGAPLVLDAAWLQRIRQYFAERGRVMPEANSIQAMIPRGATMLDNPKGTAAGIDVVAPRGEGKRPCQIFVLPGVPAEMHEMFVHHVMPQLREQSGGSVIFSRVLHTFGFGESAVAELLDELMDRDRNPTVGTTVANGIVSLRINSRFESNDRAAEELERTVELCRTRLGSLVFGQDDQTLQQVVGEMLVATHATVTTAESCTGGLLAKMLTDVPGSSEYFKMGFITYSNQSKYERLGVPTDVINVYGAVSEPVVQLMAKNARRLAKSDYAVAISGVAGPAGGSTTKPVGTVCIALASAAVPAEELRSDWAKVDAEGQIASRSFHLPGDRAWVRDRSAKMALTMLRYHLLGAPMPF